MSKENLKKENDKLKEQVDVLNKENEKLKEELNNLNENTVIMSMNDMKKRYDELEMNTVSYDIFEQVKFDLKKAKKLINTIDSINDINKTRNCDLSRFINNYISEQVHYDEKYKEERINRDIEYLSKNHDMLSLLINKFEEEIDEFSECPYCNN